MSAKFVRKLEDFVCENCGTKVSGNGYTNHCPNCLWSKHVDVNPGDRNNGCRGLMRPVNLESKGGGYVIVHQCVSCGQVKKNKADTNDSNDALVALAQSFAKSGG